MAWKMDKILAWWTKFVTGKFRFEIQWGVTHPLFVTHFECGWILKVLRIAK